MIAVYASVLLLWTLGVFELGVSCTMLAVDYTEDGKFTWQALFMLLMGLIKVAASTVLTIALPA